MVSRDSGLCFVLDTGQAAIIMWPFILKHAFIGLLIQVFL